MADTSMRRHRESVPNLTALAQRSLSWLLDPLRRQLRPLCRQLRPLHLHHHHPPASPPMDPPDVSARLSLLQLLVLMSRLWKI
jgi:hypothetical protein